MRHRPCRRDWLTLDLGIENRTAEITWQCRAELRDARTVFWKFDKTVCRRTAFDGIKFGRGPIGVAGFVVVIRRCKKTFAAPGVFWRDGVREFGARKRIVELAA